MHDHTLEDPCQSTTIREFFHDVTTMVDPCIPDSPHHTGERHMLEVDCHAASRLKLVSHAIVCQINAPWTEIGRAAPGRLFSAAHHDKLISFRDHQAVQYRNQI